MEWAFVLHVLNAWGFFSKFCELIYSCLSTVSFELLVNGGNEGLITPNRGLRQGDPLSHFLFILCLEVLSKLLNKEERSKEVLSMG